MSAQQEAPLHNDPSVMDYMEHAEGVGEHPVRRQCDAFVHPCCVGCYVCVHASGGYPAERYCFRFRLCEDQRDGSWWFVAEPHRYRADHHRDVLPCGAGIRIGSLAQPSAHSYRKTPSSGVICGSSPSEVAFTSMTNMSYSRDIAHKAP